MWLWSLNCFILMSPVCINWFEIYWAGGHAQKKGHAFDHTEECSVQKCFKTVVIRSPQVPLGPLNKYCKYHKAGQTPETRQKFSRLFAGIDRHAKDGWNSVQPIQRMPQRTPRPTVSLTHPKWRKNNLSVWHACAMILTTHEINGLWCACKGRHWTRTLRQLDKHICFLTPPFVAQWSENCLHAGTRLTIGHLRQQFMYSIRVVSI